MTLNLPKSWFKRAATSEAFAPVVNVTGPLLLTEGTPDITWQVNDARFGRENCWGCPDYCGDTVFTCRVDPRGYRGSIPPWLRLGGPIGCVAVQSYTFNEARNGDVHNAESFILFHNQPEFRMAHSIARRLAKATRGNPANISEGEYYQVTYTLLSERHHSATTVEV